jgi:hypothetical protein
MVQMHSAAVVDLGAKVGDFTCGWHLCHIESRAVVRENCSLAKMYMSGTAVDLVILCRSSRTWGSPISSSVLHSWCSRTSHFLEPQ